MTQTVVSFRPYGAVLDLFHSREPELMLSGPAGTGKSRGVLEKMHLIAQKYDGCRLLMARQTRKSMTQSVLVTFEKKVLHPADGVHFRVSEQEYRYPNGSTIVVAGLDDQTKILSTEFDIAYVAEAIEIDVGDWETVLGRLRYGVVPYSQIIGDTNPGSTQHWIYKRHLARGLRMLWSRHEDNPVLFDQATGRMTQFGSEYLSRLDRMTGFRKERLRYGRWVGAEGLVYTDFNAETMIRSADVTDWPRKVLGVDIGTRNPTAIERIAQSGDDRIHIAGEVYRANMTSGEIITAIEREADDFGAELIFVDPSALAYIEQLKADGYPAEKANNDRRFGVAAVHDAIDRGFSVDPSCVGFLEEIGLYAYPQNASEKDDPVKMFDHAMDGTRYGVVGLAEMVMPGIW